MPVSVLADRCVLLLNDTSYNNQQTKVSDELNRCHRRNTMI